MINLITSFFIPKEVERQEELLKCLKYNVDCPYFKKIYFLIQLLFLLKQFVSKYFSKKIAL